MRRGPGDLDLYLWDVTSQPGFERLFSGNDAVGADLPPERIAAKLPAGEYMVEVRSWSREGFTFRFNRAGYQLRALY